MLLQFIRRDPAWKLTPWFTAIAAGAALFYSVRHDTSLVAALSVPLYVILFTRALPHQRVTFFEAALPVSVRDLFLARLLSLMTLVWLPAAVAAILLLAANGSRTIPAVALVAMIGVVLTLANIVILSVRLQEFAAPVWLTLAGPIVAGCILALALSSPHPMAITAACSLAAVILGLRTWNNLPKAFQSAPVAISARWNERGSAAPSLPWWPVIRSLLPWQVWIFIPIALIWSVSGEWIFAPMYLMMAYVQTRATTRWALALPIPRQVLLMASVLPLLMVLAGGVEYGMQTGLAQKGHDLVRQGDPDHFRTWGAIDVVVSREFWRKAPGGVVPFISAPWGETFSPPPFRLLGMTFYNPYAVGQKNSLEFQNWQFARATLDIYGRPMTARELATSKLSNLKPVTMRPRMQILTVAAVLATALFWVWLIELFSWHRIGRLSTQARNTLTYSMAMSPIFLLMGVDLLTGNRPGYISKAALEAGLLFLSRILPANEALLVILCMLALAGIFWIVGRQARRGEIYGQTQQSKNIFGMATG